MLSGSPTQNIEDQIYFNMQQNLTEMPSGAPEATGD